MTYLGEFAALAAALCWSWTMIFFTAAGQRIGAFQVNVIRLSIAVILLTLTSWMLVDGGPSVWFTEGKPVYLFLSGVIGLALGDFALFSALVRIGPRKTTLIFATSPIITALIAWITIGETLSALVWLGISLTIAGVAWVIVERDAGRFNARGRALNVGIGFALLGTLGQSIGLVLTKIGMSESTNPLPATLMRMVGGLLTVYLMTLVMGRLGQVRQVIRDRRALLFVLGGATFGPFAGVWLSVVAVKHSQTGIAATLMSTVPILILPVVWLVYKEKITTRSIWGTLVAVVGVALLFHS